MGGMSLIQQKPQRVAARMTFWRQRGQSRTAAAGISARRRTRAAHEARSSTMASVLTAPDAARLESSRSSASMVATALCTSRMFCVMRELVARGVPGWRETARVLE